MFLSIINILVLVNFTLLETIQELNALGSRTEILGSKSCSTTSTK